MVAAVGRRAAAQHYVRRVGGELTEVRMPALRELDRKSPRSAKNV